LAVIFKEGRLCLKEKALSNKNSAFAVVGSGCPLISHDQRIFAN
jgi:hypothetical protein